MEVSAGLELRWRLDSGEFRSVLAAVPLDRLRPHEGVMASSVKLLTRSIVETGVQKNPIIVDARTGVILDGMHRWHALRAAGARYAAACLVDYSDPRIRLGRWIRLFPDASYVPSWLRGWLGGLCDPHDALSKGRPFLYIRGKAWELLLPRNKLRAMSKLRRAERALRKVFGRAVYVPDALPEKGLALVPPRLGKEDVVSVALSGVVFPPKSTRHEIPVRPLYLNVPLNLLRSSEPPDVVSEALASLLASKVVVEAPLGVTAEREYRESVLIFWGW